MISLTTNMITLTTKMITFEDDDENDRFFTMKMIGRARRAKADGKSEGNDCCTLAVGVGVNHKDQPEGNNRGSESTHDAKY